MVTKSFYRSVDLINLIGKTTITNQLIKKTERILLAISGGQDSICLLILFNQLYAQMELHLGLFWCHHLWQIDSFSLMRQMSKISFLFQFNGCFAIPSKFVPSELLARNWRHNSSYRICLFYNYSNISLAHSANDKVETILLNLMRGTGISGLSPLHWTKKISQESVQNEEHMSQHPTSLISIFSWSPRNLITTSLSAVPSHCPLGHKRGKQALGGLRSWKSMESVNNYIDQQSPKWHYWFPQRSVGEDCQYESKVNKSSDSFWFDGGFNKFKQQNKTIRINKFIDVIGKPTRIYANKKCSDNEIEYLWRTFFTSQTKKSISSVSLRGKATKNKSIWDKNHLCWDKIFRLENLLHPSTVPKALLAFLLTVPLMALLTESTLSLKGLSIVPFRGPGDCALFLSIVDNKICLKNLIDSPLNGTVDGVNAFLKETVNSAINDSGNFANTAAISGKKKMAKYFLGVLQVNFFQIDNSLTVVLTPSTVPLGKVLTVPLRGKSTLPLRGLPIGKPTVPLKNKNIEHLHNFSTTFPIDYALWGIASAVPFSKNSVACTIDFPLKGNVNKILKRVFFQKRIKRVKLKTKNRILAKNKKESKATTWFYFVSYTFFKNCSTSLE